MAGRSSDLERCAAIGRRVGVFESRCFVVPWNVVERSLGTMLPDAYKAFIEYFGPGCFSEEFQYFTPGIESSAYELVHVVLRNHGRWSSVPWTHALADTVPFPESGGVLMFARIGDDATAQWRTGSGDPNSWGIVIDHGSLTGDLEFVGDFLDLVSAMLDEAPEVDDLEYYPELMAVFFPGDGSVPDGARMLRLEPISCFATHGAA